MNRMWGPLTFMVLGPAGRRMEKSKRVRDKGVCKGIRPRQSRREWCGKDRTRTPVEDGPCCQCHRLKAVRGKSVSSGSGR